jgi:hypothetical protein
MHSMSSRNRTNFVATLVVLCAGAGGCVDGGSSALAPQSGGALRIEAEALPEATLDEPYRAAVTAVSGTPPYRWSVVSGGLAPGLQVAMEGSPSTSIAGTPQDRGTFEFRLRVEDAAGDRAERAMQLVVAVEDLPLRITTGGIGPIIFPEARLGQAYSAAVIAAGGFGPYRWSLSAAPLPDGLQLRPSGTPDTVVLGAATELGTFSGLITVSDARGATDTKPFFGAVTRATGMLEITTRSLPTATACVPFEAQAGLRNLW